MVEVEEKKGELPSFEEFRDRLEKWRVSARSFSGGFVVITGLLSKLTKELKHKVRWSLYVDPPEKVYRMITENPEYREMALKELGF